MRHFRASLLGLSLLLPTAAGAAPATLRACADPDNAPFSTSKPGLPGFYLEVANAVGGALGRPVEPVWELTYFGTHATKDTLLSGKCDMSVGLPADKRFMGPKLIRSQPFIKVGFALVTKAELSNPTLASLAGQRVAVQQGTPPQSLLALHDGITLVTYLDPESAVKALLTGDADAAFVWGPSAGYLNHAQLHDALHITPIAGDGMQWQVAIGFSKTHADFRDAVNGVLPGLASQITALSAKYGFPTQAPVELAEGSANPSIIHADLTREAPATPAPAAVATLADDTAGVTDQQANAANFVAGNRGPADIAFKPSTAPGAAEAGRGLFNSNCNHCHGPDAIQSVRRINLRLLHHRYGDDMDQVFHYTVTHGRPTKGMPNWSGVYTEDEFSKILAFLHSVQDNSN